MWELGVRGVRFGHHGGRRTNFSVTKIFN